MQSPFFSRPIKEIVCLRTLEDGKTCGRHLGDVREDMDFQHTLCCPKCGREWLVSQEAGVVRMQPVPKGLKKNYGADDGVRVVESEVQNG